MQRDTGVDQRRYIAAGRFAGKSLRRGVTFEIPLAEIGVTDRYAPDRVAVDVRFGPFDITLQIRSAVQVYRFTVENEVAQLGSPSPDDVSPQTQNWLSGVLRYAGYELGRWE